MRLTKEMGAQGFDTRIFGKEVLNDMCEIYGGEIYSSSNPVDGGRTTHFTSPNQWVRGFKHGRGGNRKTPIVGIRGLDQSHQAVRWTALQAYREKNGVPLLDLVVEVPGLVAAKEWSGRARQQEEGWIKERDNRFTTESNKLIARNLPDEQYEPLAAQLQERLRRSDTANPFRDRDFFIVPSPASGKSRVDNFFRTHRVGMDNGLRHTGDGLTSEQHRLRDIGISDSLDVPTIHNQPEEEDTVSRIYVRRHGDLYLAAKRLVDGYGKLVYRDADDITEQTVARALGAVDMAHLSDVWSSALAERTPIKAAKTALRALQD